MTWLPVLPQRRSQEFVLGGVLLRPEVPKFEVKGRQEGFLGRGHRAPSTPARSSREALLSSPSRVRVEPRPEINTFIRNKCTKKNEQESPAVADKSARRLRKICTVYVRAVGL